MTVLQCRSKARRSLTWTPAQLAGTLRRRGDYPSYRGERSRRPRVVCNTKRVRWRRVMKQRGDREVEAVKTRTKLVEEARQSRTTAILAIVTKFRWP